jgi:ectoine hydroxylase
VVVTAAAVAERDRLGPAELRAYAEDGLLVMPRLFDDAEVEALRTAFDRDARIPGEHRIAEPDGGAVRAVYSSHRRQPEFATLARATRLLGRVQQLLTPDVYLYQFKINSKSSFGGQSWAWHQDYIAWRLADNLLAPRLLNVAVFLDDVSEFNGPVVFVPGSHTDGTVRADRSAEHQSEQHLDPDDIALSVDQLAGLVDRHGMVSPKGPAGTVVFFHPEIVHGSSVNMSPHPRRLLIATYNDVTNPPRPIGPPRPEYLVCRDTRALEATDDEITVAR